MEDKRHAGTASERAIPDLCSRSSGDHSSWVPRIDIHAEYCWPPTQAFLATATGLLVSMGIPNRRPPPDDIARTPFKPSKLLLIHALWLINSVGLYVVFALISGVGLVVSVLAEMLPGVFGLDNVQQGYTAPVWVVAAALTLYTGAFASFSSWMWFGSLRRSLAHFRHMNSVGDSGINDAAGHYLAPFRKATGWAFATLPIYIGLVVLIFSFWQNT